MPQVVKTAIDINGKPIHQFSSLTVTQGIAAHHRFQLVCPAETVNGDCDILFNMWNQCIGGALHVKILPENGEKPVLFNGVVTNIEAARFGGHAGDVVVSGYSPTILLDNGPHCKSWERKAIKNIVQNVLEHFPGNLLTAKIAPLYGETLSYVVQYKESAWQFIHRLAATYGEWLFYDGQKLWMAPLKPRKTIMSYGAGLMRFNMCMQLKPVNFQWQAYNYLKNETYQAAPENIAGMAGLNEWGVHALQKSLQLYDTMPRQWHNQYLANKKRLNDCVNIRASALNSDSIRFKGVSDSPGVQLGNTVSIQVKNETPEAGQSLGDYTVIEVSHFCDDKGNYSNEFTAIPATVKMPPLMPFAEPRGETQSAVVADNNDPQGLGRVRVQFRWMNGVERSPWLRVVTPHAGENKGLYLVPETGEEVIVAFEGDNPARPYVAGSVFHGKAKTSFGDSSNNLKVFQTRSGNKIILNDEAGSIQVEDKAGNSLKLDGTGNIKMVSKQTLLLECGQARIEMNHDGKIQINGASLNMDATGKVAVQGSLITLN